jgi:hypothetical protein
MTRVVFRVEKRDFAATRKVLSGVEALINWL